MKPKFCGMCGKELIEKILDKPLFPPYDAYTGKKFNPEKYDVLECPDFNVLDGVGWHLRHDSWFFNNKGWLKIR